jgi:hypothetical protein
MFPGLGLISRAMRRGCARLLVAAVVLPTLAASGGCDHIYAFDPVPPLESIEITPPSTSVGAGTSMQLSATAIFVNQSHSNITGAVVWSTSNPAVATVDAHSGRARAVGPGSTLVSATLNGHTASATLTVKAAPLASIAVTPPAPSIAAGTTEAFIATGTFSDNTTQNLTGDLNWVSSNPAIATVNASGQATAMSPGATTISATCATASSCGSLSGSAILTVTAATLVSIAVTPPTPSLAVGTSQQFTATGTYTDNSTQNLTGQVTWASGTPLVATISNVAGSAGLARAVATGVTHVTATLGSVTSAPATLTVTAATLVSIAVTPSSPSVALGTTQQFTAAGTYTDNSTQNLTSEVTWSSGTTSVATISNAAGSAGLATSAAPGTTEITATLGSVTSAPVTLAVTAATLVSIGVTPPSPSIALGTTQQFTATGTYTDNSTQNLTSEVTWSSSTTSVATISNAAGSAGLASSAVTGTTGTTTITASLGSVTSTPTTLTVTAATLVSIAVTPVAPTIADGLTQQFTATGTYTDSSTQNLTAQVTWASTSTSIATVGNVGGSQGLASAAAVGSTTISATSDGISGSTTLTVTPALYSIGGSISGLSASGLALTDNGGNTLSVNAAATSFTFSTQLASGTPYAVAVSTQPTGQTCSVSNGSGTATADVTSVAVSCVPNYTIGGTISGLSVSSVVLANGSAAVTVSAGATSWVLPSSFASGSSYSVTVQTQPAGEYCQVTSGGSGTLSDNVSNVAVTCLYGYGYSYSQSITVNSGQVSGGPLTNFPFLFNTTDANLATSAHGGGVQNANGYDIIFMGLDSTTCNGPSSCTLDFEVESYNATTGQMTAWVNIPSINNSTVIYIFYGNNSITTSQAQPTGVWDSNYKAVYHAGNGSTLSLNDSTSNANNLTNHGSVTEIAGPFGGAFSLNGSNQYLTPGGPWLASSPAAFTFQVVAYPTQTANPATPVSLGTSNSYVTELYQNRTSWAFLINPTLITSSNSVTANSWNNYVAGTWDGSSLRLYLNGSLIAGPISQSYPGGVTNEAIGVLLETTPLWYFQGYLTEVRLSSIPRSAGWIATEYNNQSAPGSFYTLGPTITY